MQLSKLLALVAFVTLTNAAAIPTVDARSELYQCASSTKRDINGRCPPSVIVREAAPEAEAAELYQCASSTKRDINGRCT